MTGAESCEPARSLDGRPGDGPEALTHRPHALGQNLLVLQNVAAARSWAPRGVRAPPRARRAWQPPWSAVIVDAELHQSFDGLKFREPGRAKSPDLIIHKRGCDDANLLAIEAKHHGNDLSGDLEKLGWLCSERAYHHAWAVRLDASGLDVVVRVKHDGASASPSIAG